MKTLVFSLYELQTARIILDDKKDYDLFPPSFLTWAKKVVRWFAKLWKTIKTFTKKMGNLCLATKAVWANLKKGLTLGCQIKRCKAKRTLKDHPQYRSKSRTFFDKTEDGQRMDVQKMSLSRAAKSKFRMRNRVITNKLQTL